MKSAATSSIPDRIVLDNPPRHMIIEKFSEMPNNPLPSVPVDRATLLKYLDDSGFATTTVDHEAVFTVDQSKEIHETMEGGHTKNLFLKDKKSNYFMMTVEQDSQVNLKSLHKLLGASGRFSFGSAEKMVELLGVTPGSVTALAVINDREGQVKFAVDQRLMRHEKINCHPLTNEATTTLLTNDLLAFARACGHDPMIVDLTTEV